METLAAPTDTTARAHRAPILRRAWWGAIAIVLASSVVVHLLGVLVNPVPTDEEGTYTAQAWAVIHWNKLAPYTYWYDHPPLGWLLLAYVHALVAPVLVAAPDAVASMREVMVLITAVTLVAVVVFGRRMGWHPAAIMLAVVLLATAPLAVELQRLVELDNIAVMWVAISLALLADPSRRLRSVVLASLALGAAIVSVETALLMVPTVLWLLRRRYPRDDRAVLTALFLVVAGGVGALYVVYATVKGELMPGPGHVSLLGSALWQLMERQGSGFAWSSHSIAAGVLRSWEHYSRVLLAVGAGSVLLLANRDARPFSAGVAIYLVAGFHGGYLPVTFPVEPLLLAALAWAAFAASVARARRIRGHVAVAVLTGVVALGLAARWERADLVLLAHPVDQSWLQAERWMAAHADRNRPILVGDSQWVDYVAMGWRPDLVVWYYKLTTDPEVERRYPGGWRSMSYVVVTPGMAAAAGSLPYIASLERASHVVARFSSEGGTVTIYRPAPPVPGATRGGSDPSRARSASGALSAG